MKCGKHDKNFYLDASISPFALNEIRCDSSEPGLACIHLAVWQLVSVELLSGHQPWKHSKQTSVMGSIWPHHQRSDNCQY